MLAFETARQTQQVSTHVILIDTVAQLSEQLFSTDDTQLNTELDQHLKYIKHQYSAVDREIVFNAFKRNIEAMMEYRTTPLDGKVFDIRASETNKQMVQAKNATWLEATDHSVVYLPGDHFSILDSNNHSALADLINRNIARGAPVAGKAQHA